MPKTNLVFILTDQQRWDTLRVSKNSDVLMPNLHRFAETCTVFDKTYVTQPICTPSRSTIMTGLYPHTTGCTENNLPLSQDVPCIVEILPDGIWKTAFYGKWHLGDEIFLQHGFDEWVSTEDMYWRYYSPEKDQSERSDYHHYLLSKGYSPANNNRFTRLETARLKEEDSKPAFLAEKARDFISRNSRRPFILYVSFLEPHPPYYGPRNDQHDPEKISLPENYFDGVPKANQSSKAQLLYRYYNGGANGGLAHLKDVDDIPLPLKSERQWRKIIARYRGLCSQIDSHVGTILSALEEYELFDKTIVVYTSDHGDMMGSHKLLEKGVMFEEAVRVPMLIRLPGQSGRRVMAQPVSQIDLVPTLLDLVDVRIPGHLQGKSLKASLASGGRSQTGDIFIEWSPACKVDNPRRKELDRSIVEAGRGLMSEEHAREALSASLRTVITPEGWKLNWSSTGEQELYNLKDDPREIDNLAGHEECSATIDKLKDKIQRWQQITQDR